MDVVIPKAFKAASCVRAYRIVCIVHPIRRAPPLPLPQSSVPLISDDGLSVALDAAVCCGGTSAIATSPRSGATLWRRRQHGVFSKTARDDRVPFAAQTWTVDRHRNPAATNCRSRSMPCRPISEIHGASLTEAFTSW